jgi:hypothetical protein
MHLLSRKRHRVPLGPSMDFIPLWHLSCSSLQLPMQKRRRPQLRTAARFCNIKLSACHPDPEQSEGGRIYFLRASHNLRLVILSKAKDLLFYRRPH